MKDLRFAALLDFYGKVLTQKQYTMTKQYYHCDCSLSEIAEHQGISRQAVHASLRQAQHTLLDLEQKLGFYQKTVSIRDELEKSTDADAEALKKTLTRIGEIL
jgi:predicted DNA-binding protein YlxM (UPF0122 family)